MDITFLRVASTVACFVTFLAICWWAYAGSNRERFAQDALIPFDHD